jgi:hypothetical protein
LATQLIFTSGTNSIWRPRLTFDVEAREFLHGVGLKIERAISHVAEVDALIRTFGDSHRIIREIEPDGVSEMVKLHVGPMPEMLPVVIGEVIFQLRSALDFVVCGLVAANHKSVEHVHFPIAENKMKFKNMREIIRKLPSKAQRYLRRLKPYGDGTGGRGDILWALNHLRNSDVHTGLLTLVAHGQDVEVVYSISGTPESTVVVEVPQQPVERELFFARSTHGAKVDLRKINFDVAFRDIKIFEGKPLITVLQQLIQITQRISKTMGALAPP